VPGVLSSAYETSTDPRQLYTLPESVKTARPGPATDL
jgi:hypothetical protein